MSYLRNLFRRPSEFTLLDNRVAALEADLARERWRNEQLEKEIRAANRKKDAVLLRHADMMSEVAKLRPHFVNDAAPKEPEKPKEYTPDEREKVQWLAQTMRDADLENGIDTPLEHYEQLILSDPNGIDSFVLQ